MNQIVPFSEVTTESAAPIGFGPGGPLPPPAPWIIHGSWISYLGGVVIGNPTGGNKGPGTINASSVFQNGVHLDVSNFLPLTGGTVGPLTVNGAFTVAPGWVTDGVILDMGTY